ncbi:ABC transporter ATP-binding protein [Saccharopolyspora sp. ASAGF58]|uniref:ABC transporter ATP-binding protein n=1 Tax=Saccharopolyspora sp. ASAGF58 TaxID=2719023 RepID=UPI001B312FF3|nr:ABC transporter ATP-binding protein [Saccharopolyspora sp. ASAGF58]
MTLAEAARSLGSSWSSVLLDARVRAQLRDEIRRVQLDVGTTTLFVTHDQEEALAMADRVGVMSAGRLQQLATPVELYNRPRTAFVAEFVGLTNRLAGVVDNAETTVLGTRLPLLEGSATSGDATVFVRPESVQVTPRDDGNGRVLSVSFLGSLCRIHTRLADGAEVLAQVSNTEGANLAAGTPVQVSIRPTPVLATSGRKPDNIN